VAIAATAAAASLYSQGIASLVARGEECFCDLLQAEAETTAKVKINRKRHKVWPAEAEPILCDETRVLDGRCIESKDIVECIDIRLNSSLHSLFS
jgi:hypothetical protein